MTLTLSMSLLAGVIAARPAPTQDFTYLPLSYPTVHVAVVSDSYTTGTDQGGNGAKNWAPRAWQNLAAEGVAVTADVEAEGGAGYGIRGNHGSVFEDLTSKAVKPDDKLVVFFGSRNDEPFDPAMLPVMVYGTLQLARHIAPSAKMLVIGPAWPTAAPPPAITHIRDVLSYQANLAGATFYDPIAAGWFVDRPELIGKDGIHPTDAGHAYMADKIAPLIGAQLTWRV